MKQRVSRERYIWSGAILTFISIMFMAAWGRAIQHFAEKFFGKKILVSITLIFVIAGGWLLYSFVLKVREHRLRRLVLFSIIASVYIWRLMSLHVQVERFHLIEYGLLAILVCLGCLKRNMGLSALGWGLAAAWFGGLCDEFFQWWLPARVGEWRDVVINIQSGILGLAAFSLAQYKSLKPMKPQGKTIVYLLLCFMVLSVLSGQFILKVHVFGVENVDPELGRFNSLFTKEQLTNATIETYLNTVEKAGGHQTKNFITDHFLYFYELEAREHYARTHLLTEQDRLDEAKTEYLLSKKYYFPWLTANKMQFNNDVLTRLGEHSSANPESFTSHVMDWYWVSSSRDYVLWWSLFMGLIFAFLAALSWRIIL